MRDIYVRKWAKLQVSSIEYGQASINSDVGGIERKGKGKGKTGVG